MIPPTTAEPAAPALQAAVDAVEVAVEHLIKLVGDGALCDLGAFGLVETMQRFETVRNKLPVVDRAMIAYGTEQGVPAALSERSMTRVLMKGLRLSAGEASRRVKAAEHLADRRSMTGEPLQPVRAHLSAAQRDGLVTAEQVSVIDTALRKVKHCDPAAVEAGEVLLVEQAGKLGYADLDLVAAKLVEAIDPDGILPSDEAEHRLRRFFHLKHRKDGSWAGDFRLTPEVGQKLAALLGPLTSPQTTRLDTPSDQEQGTPATKQVLPDERSQGQRRHDALETILDRLLDSADLPTSGGTPTTLIITMSWQDFISPNGIGTYPDGSPVSARTARDLADQADIAFCLKTAKGAVLDLYRSRRIATLAQTLALIARDGGCSFPACDVRPEWCERHHIIAWYDGGDTNLANLTLIIVQLPSPPVRQTWLAVPDQHRRPPGVDPTQIKRPPPTTDPEPPDHHHQLGPPRPPRLHPSRPRPTRSTRTTRLTKIICSSRSAAHKIIRQARSPSTPKITPTAMGAARGGYRHAAIKSAPAGFLRPLGRF
jgi:hypothetical protein